MAAPASRLIPLSFALVGGFWLFWILGHAVSVATSVGFIALEFVAAEFGMVMLLCLRYPRSMVPVAASSRTTGLCCPFFPCIPFRHASASRPNWRNPMKKLIVLSAALAAALATPAFAGNGMVSMDMSPKASITKVSSNNALTDAQVKKVDAATGMITLKHGALENVGMPPMTMAFKAKDASMAKQIKEGDRVKVRVEEVNGTLTIVKLEKRS